MPTSDKNFIEIRPYDPNFGRGVSMSRHNHTTHPWRIEMLESYWPTLKMVPQFGTEDGQFTVNDQSQPKSITIPKPPMQRPVMVKKPRKAKKTPQHHLSASVPLHERATTLANRHNQSLPKEPEARAEAPKSNGDKITLKQAIDAVNRFKDIHGEDLVLEVSKNGHLRGLMEFGRK